MSAPQKTETGIAIIGMAGRFPKARNTDELWRNLCEGAEGISFFSDEELTAAGVEGLKADPNYVRARGIVEQADLFDAAFFGVNPREAEVMDPQHRVFLECAWEALESAGYDAQQFDGHIGVFAGMSMNSYFARNLLGSPDLVAQVGEYQIMLGNDKDFLPTRVSYKLNLRGPSVNIQTACSTSLVAVCVACQNLLDFECDVALAGAVSLSFPQKRGYLYQEGGIASPDGHCRAFDAKAAGTVAGEGVGIVVLKRLEEALADRDQIYAVIKGFAINNDGSQKIGYTAPSVEGQAEVIATAQAMAGFTPDTISYIEAHGTGTPLGDPIEIEGLTKAFRAGTAARNFCAIGSIKSNIGHLDTAAGVVGLIKTALALRHNKLPPSLHFESPNPKIDFAGSPFYVNAKLTEWKGNGAPRRAGVSSFGIGGTNAHIVLEEAPALAPSDNSRPAQLLVFSAKTETALNQATANLAGHLKRNPDLSLADVAYTLQVGRRELACRRALVCRRVEDALPELEAVNASRVISRVPARENPPVVFMFPGQGAQQVKMGHELYQHEPLFREQVDLCAEMLRPHLGLDLRTIIYPEAKSLEDCGQRLTQTAITQPALFVIEYALAKLWMSWGVRPEAMIGHSIGEYVAACLAGVFSLENALALVATRGRLMQSLPGGTMLAVRVPESEVKPFLDGKISLAAVNAQSVCVLSGSTDAIKDVERELSQRGAGCTPLKTSHAFHSALMEPILEPFTAAVRDTRPNAPQIPFISNVTGTWITAEQAIDPNYWASHLRRTVRFADGLGELLRVHERVFLEVGPGQTLNGLAKLHPARKAETLVLSSLPRANETSPEPETLLSALGQLWLSGVSVDWQSFYKHERRCRVQLPTYPFERQRYFVEPAARALSANLPSVSAREGDRSSIPAGNGDGFRNSDVTRTGLSPFSAASERLPELALSSPERRGVPPAAAAVGKQSITAELKALFSDLSGRNLAEVNGGSTFIELGFESLFLTQASLAIERKFGVRTTFRQLMEELSTLDLLGAHLESSLPTDRREIARSAPEERGVPSRDGQSVAKGQANGDASVPLTEAQKEIWFASQMSDGASCAYNETRLLNFRGRLQAELLQRAMQCLVDRHDALRVTVSPHGDFQQISPRLTVEIPLIDFSCLDPTQAEAQWKLLETAEASQPFDLVKGPLLRARLIRFSPEHHVLLWSIHHIVCDGRSWVILVRELGELYSAQCCGTADRLRSPAQLTGFARAEASRRAVPERASAEAYWLGQFSDGTPTLELPTDRVRPSTWTFNGACESESLDSSLAQGLRRVSTQRDCTVFVILLAAYGLLLRRLTGQQDIVIGIPAADPKMAGGESLVGHCINFLPVRLRVPGDRPFAEWLAAVKRTFLEAYEHQHCTLGTLVQRLNLPRDPGRMPLVSVTFNMDRISDAPNFDGLQTEFVSSRAACCNFDLSFNVTKLADALCVECRYNTSLFLPQTVRRWLGHFRTLLEAIVADPRQKFSELSLLSADERRQILVEWNDTKAVYGRDQCVHELFEEQALRTPQAVAAVFKEETLTYGELNCQADRVAERLRKLQVGPDVPVGICTERSLEMLVGVLGILKAGGAYVPLDPAYPQERLALMLENARVPVLLTQEPLRGHFRMPASGIEVLCLEVSRRRAPFSNRGVSRLSRVSPGNLAYVIHTSGSTGVPKGVAMEHRPLLNLISWQVERSQLPPGTRTLQFASLSFDVSFQEMFSTWASGGTLILCTEELRRDPVLLLRFLGEQKVARLFLPFVALQQLAEVVTETTPLPGSLREVITAGEQLQITPKMERLFERLPDCALHNQYGPSESHVVTAFTLEGAPSQWPKLPPIGRPIANAQIYLLDTNLEPVPVGVPGELFIGGRCLARGYLNRPDLTAERFVPNPFTDEPDARLYKTGDLARWLPNGNVEFLGRIDHQVKIRGYRIELGEIETVLSQVPAVRECAVVVREDASGEKRLVAYVVAAPGQAEATAGELRTFLQNKLPDYMMPSSYVFLHALPLTPSGKVNRPALPAPTPLHSAPEENFVAPSTPTEVALEAIWCEVLGAKKIGVRDSFFDRGGHSLLMTQVISRVHEAFGVDLPVRRFFESPTIAGLASTIEELLVEEIQQLSDEEARRFAYSAG